MSNLKKIQAADFKTEVMESTLPVIIDFYADWCPPCRMLGPILDRLATEFNGQIKFLKVNSDQEQALSAAFKVTGLPTLVFMDCGKNVGQFPGLPAENTLRQELKKWLASRTAVRQ